MADFRDLIKEAIGLAGSQSALAEVLGISQQGVSYLLNEASGVSAELAVKIDRFTEGKVSKQELRPDIFFESSPASEAAA